MIPLDASIARPDDIIAVTGANGFIGKHVVAQLSARGFRRVRCLVRVPDHAGSSVDGVEIVAGNLLSRDDTRRLVDGATVVLHLAAGTGTKSFADAFLNTVVTTRNLVEACHQAGAVKRLVSLSSFAVYSGPGGPGGPAVLDESSPIEDRPGTRAEAYCYAKVKEDELILEYGRKHGLPFVLIRPGVVFGPGKTSISGRVGIDSFGLFLHFGGGNRLPLTYVENCAEAVVLAGLKPGIDGEVFNLVDDDLPTSRQFLSGYKRRVKNFPSIYVPRFASYLLCWLWEAYSSWSHEQLPPVYTRREWVATWKRMIYRNQKAKAVLGWYPRVAMAEALSRYYDACRLQRAKS